MDAISIAAPEQCNFSHKITLKQEQGYLCMLPDIISDLAQTQSCATVSISNNSVLQWTLFNHSL